MKLDWIVLWDLNMCTCYFNWGIFKCLYFFILGGGGVGNFYWKTIGFSLCQFDNVGGAFVSFGTFLV